MEKTAMPDVQWKWIGKTGYVDRAMAAYYGRSRTTQELYQQPSRVDSGEVEYNGKRYVVLCNVKGILAVYRIKVDGYLKRMKRWPKVLDEVAES